MARLELGPTPCNEECQQVGMPDYDPTAARAECKRYIACIRAFCGEEPTGASLRVTSNPHDFGTYYEVVVDYHPDEPEAVEYAYWLESHSPRLWDGTGARMFDMALVAGESEGTSSVLLSA